ncbi:MAG: hypothetical protein QNL04_07565 [SAR324 cluster bacterium]|nr:hypothetical protein [SAR324 cluster bacterium]
MTRNNVMNHQIKIYPQDCLVVITYQGKISIAEILQASDAMQNHRDYDKSYNGICDFRNSEVLLTPNEVHAFTSHVLDGDLAQGTWCMLVDAPYATALSYIFKNQIKKQHPVAIHSTLEAASSSLGLNLSPFFY